MSLRPIKKLIKSKPTLEGAGVHLRRAFGFGNTGDFDPFLLLDDFRNDVPEDYLAGFPWHPHRGIETITYVLAGTVEHGDSMGNRGVIGSGDVQWMTAGRGISHSERTPAATRSSGGGMFGIQSWIALPQEHEEMAPLFEHFDAAILPSIVIWRRLASTPEWQPCPSGRTLSVCLAFPMRRSPTPSARSARHAPRREYSPGACANASAPISSSSVARSMRRSLPNSLRRRRASAKPRPGRSPASAISPPRLLQRSLRV